MADVTEKREPLREKLTVDQLDLLIRRLDSLPTLPGVVLRLGELMRRAGHPQGDDNATVWKIIRLTGSDPSLASRLLSLASRHRQGAASTVSQAFRQIGFDGACSAILATEVLEFPSRNGSGMDYAAFWKHCLAVACAAEMIVERAEVGVTPEVAFVCGLLHDLGKLAMEQCLPKSYGQAMQTARVHNGNITEYENRIIGVDHSTAGRRLAEYWKLPNCVQEVAWLHHQPAEAMPESLTFSSLAAIVGLADVIAREQRLGFSGNYTFPKSSRQLAEEMKLPAAIIDEVVGTLSEQVGLRCEAVGLDAPADGLACRDALVHANAELGRLNEHMHSRNRAVAGKAGAFECLKDLTAQLSGRLDVPDVLIKIAEVMASAANVAPGPARPIFFYSVEQDRKDVLIGRYDEVKMPIWRTLAKNAQFDGGLCAPTSPDEAMAALLAEPEQLQDWLDVSESVHTPFVCAGRWIGGVFLPVGEDVATQSMPGTFDLRGGLSEVLSLALAMAQAQGRMKLVSEQLAEASRALADMRDELAEAKTLAAIGELAAGAGHELNTPLAVISGRAQMMQDKADNDADRKTWGLIVEHAQKISNIVTAMMEFATPPEPKSESIDVAELLSGVVEAFSLSDHPQAKAADVDIKIADDTPAVLADKAQIQAVVLELITNAATAAGTTPRIRITAGGDEIDEAVLLTVADEGPGMDGQTIGRIFVPFFSLQQAGRRPGMGLPRARRFVDINGGRIWIRSEVGKGTTVYVQLPRA